MADASGTPETRVARRIESGSRHSTNMTISETRSDSQTTTAGPFLIAGLGNPGRAYRRNRHNVGFMALDRLSEDLQAPFTRVQARAMVTDARHDGVRLLLAKPQTYMNESGQAVGALTRFYKIPLPNLLVIFDDLDLPLGTLRLRPSGGSGGQKGMRSIIQHVGGEGFPRLRLGIGRPPGRMDPADFLLQDFSEDEQDLLDIVLRRTVEAVFSYVQDGVDLAMTKYNGSV